MQNTTSHSESDLFAPEAARRVKRPAAGAGRRRSRILVVDDGAASLKDHWLLLEEAGYEVTRCGGSLSALFAVVRVDPDLVITEVRKPTRSGLALAAELKAYRDTRHIPVVALAFSDTLKYRSAALRSGCDRYLSTHLSPHRFLGEIAKTLQGRESRGSPGLAPSRTARIHNDASSNAL